MMKSASLAVVAASLALAVSAHAQAGPPDPWGDATVTRAEAQAWAGERFDAADANRDGSLSAEETAAAAQGPGRGGGMRRADSNGDGKVSREEFVAAQLARFDTQDGNDDGQLTKAERDAARAAMMERMRDRGGWGGGSGDGQ
jgi:hypothetical protein